MTGGKHLLLLAAFVLLARCQQKPKVSVLPKLKEIICGDMFYLSCDGSGDTVKWYINDKLQNMVNKTWKIAIASPKHSGDYQCEINEQKSDKLQINVVEYIPSASLTIKTGQPVMQPGGSVMLQLESEGLSKWRCWVYRTAAKKTWKILLKLENDADGRMVFQTPRLEVPESIFWCTDKAQQTRSNQIILRTSKQVVSLEMYPLPVVAGDTLTMKCLVWGTNQVSKAVFYKDNSIITSSGSNIHTINNVTESTQGSYKCDATYKADAGRTEYERGSDAQDLFVRVFTIHVVHSANGGLMCSCPGCKSSTTYEWYRMMDDQSWAHMAHANSNNMSPKENGTYACKAVWNKKRSALSRSLLFSVQNSPNPPITGIVVSLLILLGLLIVVIVLVLKYCKKTDTTGPVYEDVALKSRDKGDDNYEPLQGAQKGAEYDTLHPEASRTQKKEGEYEPLKKEEVKEGVYHTLGMEGAVGGEGGQGGGYEALKKEGMKEGVYHTLGKEGAGGGEGGYEALKKEGMKEGVYHTLGKEGAGGEE